MFDWLKKTAPPQQLAGDATAIAARLKESAVLKSQGDQYFDEEKFAEAAQHYREAIAINPDYAEAYDNLGISLWQLDRNEEAERCLKRAISLKPEMATTHFNLGCFLHQQGRRDEALGCFDQALQIKPYFAEANH
jgi:tetratricopeptide (TPR) repeat protein